MKTRIRNIIIPGWATTPELYEELVPAGSGRRTYDFSFFQGDSSETISNFGEGMTGMCAEPCVLHAHSMGALLCFGAVAGLSSVKALVVYGGFAKFAFDPVSNPYGQPSEAIAGMRKQVCDNPAGMLKTFYRAVFHPAKYAGAYPGNFNAACLTYGLDLLASCDFRDRLAGIKIPVMMLHGRMDKVADFRLAEEMSSAIPGCTLKIFESAGHALPFTHAGDCQAATERFLDEITG